jgi:hypothetical protein
MSRTLLLAALLTVAACGGSSKPAPSTPLPDDKAQVETPPPVDGELEGAPDKQPAEPALPPIATAPAPAAAGTPDPHVAKALALLPAEANIIFGIDVPRLAATPLGDKFKAALVANGMPSTCDKLDVGQFGDVTFAAGNGNLVAVISGKLPEKVIVPCIDAGMKAKGGKLANKKISGRKVYFGTGGSDDDNGWTTWNKAGVPLFATSEASITAALDAKSPKVGAELTALANKADHTHVAWIAGRLPADMLAALGMPPGLVGGDVSFHGWLDQSAGTQLDVVIGFTTPDEANKMNDHLRQMLEPMRANPDIAQVVSGLQLGAHGNELHAVLALDEATTAKLLEAMNVN